MSLTCASAIADAQQDAYTLNERLLLATREGDQAAVTRLLDAGVDVNAAYRNHLTALMWAAGYDQEATASMLLARGAKRDLRDDRGMTAKDIAEQTHSMRVVALLSKG